MSVVADTPGKASGTRVVYLAPARNQSPPAVATPNLMNFTSGFHGCWASATGAATSERASERPIHRLMSVSSSGADRSILGADADAGASSGMILRPEDLYNPSNLTARRAGPVS